MAVKLQNVPKLGVSLKVSCMRTREIHVVEVDRPNDEHCPCPKRDHSNGGQGD